MDVPCHLAAAAQLSKNEFEVFGEEASVPLQDMPDQSGMTPLPQMSPFGGLACSGDGVGGGVGVFGGGGGGGGGVGGGVNGSGGGAGGLPPFGGFVGVGLVMAFLAPAPAVEEWGLGVRGGGRG